MANEDEQSRRSFLRSLGMARTSRPSTNQKDGHSDATPAANRTRKLRGKQFSILSIILVSAALCIFLAMYREAIFRHPLLVLGAVAVSIVFQLMLEGFGWLVDRLVWKIFSERDK